MDLTKTTITPEMIVTVCEAFESAGEGGTDWLVELICRTMLKAGPPLMIYRPKLAMDVQK